MDSLRALPTLLTHTRQWLQDYHLTIVGANGENPLVIGSDVYQYYFGIFNDGTGQPRRSPQTGLRGLPVISNHTVGHKRFRIAPSIGNMVAAVPVPAVAVMATEFNSLPAPDATGDYGGRETQ